MARYIAGFQNGDRWEMVTLSATTLTEAKRERESLVSGLREGRIAQRDDSTFGALFDEWQDARTISPRTKAHERHLLDRHLGILKGRRVQNVDARDLAKILRGMRDDYSPWTQTAVYRIAVAVFSFAEKRGVIVKSPVNGLTDAEKPTQRNKTKIYVLSDAEIERLIAAATTERWKAAIGLAGYAGLRLGEVRGLRWGDLDFDANVVYVRRSLLPDGTPVPTKTEAGNRPIPMVPALRRALLTWKIKSPYTAPEDYVVVAAGGVHVMERNLRRALDRAKEAAGLDGTEERLSWHSLRHSYASSLATDLDLAATTLARATGHSDAGFTLRVYAKDARDEAAFVSDVLKRAASAGIGQ